MNRPTDEELVAAEDQRELRRRYVSGNLDAGALVLNVARDFPELEVRMRNIVHSVIRYTTFEPGSYAEIEHLKGDYMEDCNGIIIVWDREDANSAVVIGVSDPELVPGQPWEVGSAFSAHYPRCEQIIFGELDGLSLAFYRAEALFIKEDFSTSEAPDDFVVPFFTMYQAYKDEKSRLDTMIATQMEQVFRAALIQEEFVADYWFDDLYSSWELVDRVDIGRGSYSPKAVVLLALRSQGIVLCIPTEDFWMVLKPTRNCYRNWLIATAVWNQAHGSLMAEPIRGSGTEVVRRGTSSMEEELRLLQPVTGPLLVRDVGYRLDLDELNERLDLPNPLQNHADLIDLAEREDFHGDLDSPAMQA